MKNPKWMWPISPVWGPDAFTSDDDIAERMAIDEADCLAEINNCGSIQGGHGAYNSMEWLAACHGWQLSSNDFYPAMYGLPYTYFWGISGSRFPYPSPRGDNTNGQCKNPSP